MTGQKQRYSRRTTTRRRLAVLAALTPLGVIAASAALASRSEPAPPPGERQTPASAGAVRAFLIATGIFAQPAPSQQSGEFVAAEAAAAAAGAPVAFTIWTDQESFDARAWRDLIQVGRPPVYPPPAIDFMRDVTVLIWPVTGQAPAPVLHAPGLVLRGATLRHTAVELHIGPFSGGPAPATPAPGGDVLPYALVTVPRDQWPVPVPPPTIPPLAVSLAP